MRGLSSPLGDWREQAACWAMEESSIFFPENGDYRAAKAVCAGCPVRSECLEHALKEEKSSAGCWGGKDPHERRSINRARLKEARKRRVA